MPTHQIGLFSNDNVGADEWVACEDAMPTKIGSYWLCVNEGQQERDRHVLPAHMAGSATTHGVEPDKYWKAVDGRLLYPGYGSHQVTHWRKWIWPDLPMTGLGNGDVDKRMQEAG